MWRAERRPPCLPKGGADTIGLRFSARHPPPGDSLFDMTSRGSRGEALNPARTLLLCRAALVLLERLNGLPALPLGESPRAQFRCAIASLFERGVSREAASKTKPLSTAPVSLFELEPPPE